MLPGRGIELVELLESRDGCLTLLELADGRVVRAFNCAAGRDMGDAWEHMTLNISPDMAGEKIDFLRTSDVVHAVDPDTSDTLYIRTHP
ncbi:hypothetical protein [Brevundimonas sp.]|uniref:hypothetical protein n=1 Tax=Brevundimonas sp. TaxID=1871086 RepID=UPI0027314DB3|nr:hypothetical protein [Brevundimonas sp.]MDP1914018.1 hypothetical protein [Brevundimonas sp.]